jgi:hypothetical protein
MRLKEHLDLKRPSHIVDHIYQCYQRTSLNKVELLHLSQRSKVGTRKVVKV